MVDGLYHPATLVKDAERHGVTVLPACVPRRVDLAIVQGDLRPPRAAKPREPPRPREIRLGLRSVKGLREAAARRIVANRLFASMADLAHRSELRMDDRDARRVRCARFPV